MEIRVWEHCLLKIISVESLHVEKERTIRFQYANNS